MFNDVTVSPGISSGFKRDEKLTPAMTKLARLRQDRSVTSTDHAGFKEGERAPVAGASPA